MAEALVANPGVRVLATTDINGPPLADSLKSLLGTIVIQIPSLVDRTEDIPLLGAMVCRTCQCRRRTPGCGPIGRGG